jgi:hypothetical protein
VTRRPGHLHDTLLFPLFVVFFVVVVVFFFYPRSFNPETLTNRVTYPSPLPSRAPPNL